MTDDPFAPVGGPKKPRLRVVGGNADLVCVMPAPKGAPRFPTRHPKLGEPSLSWAYRDTSGGFLGEIWRFNRDGEKEFRPVTLWRNAKGQLEWRFQSWPEPRPLYGLDRLGARPGSPVIVTEGEKAADAAARSLGGYVAVSWPGGANAPAKASWEPLRGRAVTVWPDADAPGAKCAAAVAELAIAAGAASVAIASPPEGVAAGWDAADAEAEGWTPAKAEALVKAARPFGASEAGAKCKRPPAGEADAPKRGVGAYVRLVDAHTKCLFHDAAGRAYAAVIVGEHVENLAILSKPFANWLSLTSYAEGLTPPNKSTLGDAQRILEARALSEGPLKEPFLRVGVRGDKIYVNMADQTWRVIEVGAKGWTVLAVHDLPNIRSAAMLPMLEPQETDEGIEILRRFGNADESGFRLVVAYLLSSLYPPGPYPVLIPTGEQGSAKSSLTKRLRDLIDPNFAPLRAMPKEEVDIIVAAMHAHIIALDNVSLISGEMSDALCRVATGGGMSARAKYSDADEFVAHVKAPIIINGISLALRPDLASRALAVRLESIPDDARMTEGELEQEWSKVAPRVLAILLDALSAALARLPQTRPPKVSRMADFERLIEAASPFLGWEPGEFAEIYRANQSESDAAAIEADPIAGAIVDMVRDDHSAGWEGTMSRLLEILSTKVSEAVRRSRLWPATAGSLGMRLDRVKPALRRHGVGITRWHSGERRIRIFPIAAPQPTLPTSPDDA